MAAAGGERAAAAGAEAEAARRRRAVRLAAAAADMVQENVFGGWSWHGRLHLVLVHLWQEQPQRISATTRAGTATTGVQQALLSSSWVVRLHKVHWADVGEQHCMMYEQQKIHVMQLGSAFVHQGLLI
jgi:hypothetical protein